MPLQPKETPMWQCHVKFVALVVQLALAEIFFWVVAIITFSLLIAH